jgi:uncharacterized repeat protein (TIGR01451 family)
VVKTGPAQAVSGDLITYSLTYSNAGAVNGTSVVMKDFLPAYTTVLTNTLNGGSLSNNTVSWSLGTVAIQTGGSKSFQVRVNTNPPPGLSITNRSQVFGSEAEEPGKTTDNYSSVITRIVCVSPVMLNPLTSLTNCPGSSATFSASATGTGLTYQWYKGASLLMGQTNFSLVLNNVVTNAAGTYRVVVTGSCGTPLTNSATLTVTAWPTIACSNNKFVQVGDAWTFDTPTANYPLTVLSTVTNTAGHCGNTFDATRTWQTTDACGNSALCSQTVTVNDTVAPTLVCAANKTVECGAAWTFDAPTATDIGGTNTITIFNTVTNAACGNTFSATRTWKATDACGNAAQCSQTVTVVDTTAPTIACVGNKTIEAGAAWTFNTPTASDGCGTAIIEELGTVTNLACGNTFSATRTWRATDSCGNAAECSQTMSVVD